MDTEHKPRSDQPDRKNILFQRLDSPTKIPLNVNQQTPNSRISKLM